MIIAVASFKGGVGKTTTAIHLAAYCQTLASTVLIDADPNRSSSAWAARGELPFDVVDVWSPARMRHYSHVIIDTQARPMPEDLVMIADTCELILLPTTPDILSLEALALTLEHLYAIEARRYRVLMTIVPPKPSKEGEQTRRLLSESNIPVCETGVRRLAAFHKAATAGTLVNQVRDPRSHLGWEDYQSVGAELLGLGDLDEEPPTGDNRDEDREFSELSSLPKPDHETEPNLSQKPDADNPSDDLRYYDPPDTIEF